MSKLLLDVAPRGLTTLITVTPIMALVGVLGLGLAGGLFALLRRFKVRDVHAVIASAGLMIGVCVASAVVTTARVNEENRLAREHRNEQRMRAEERSREAQRRAAATSAQPISQGPR